MTSLPPSQQRGRRPVPTLIHDGQAWVRALHYDQKLTDLDYANDEIRRMAVENRCLREAMERLAGDYGCTTIEPLDPAFPPTGEPCRDRRPDQPETWCYACHATVALTGEQR